jgi:hypothetical protein
VLFNNWIMAREEAIARVRTIEHARPKDIALFRHVLARSDLSVSRWTSAHPIQQAKLASLRADLDALKMQVDGTVLEQDYPWDRLCDWSQRTLGEEGQELLASLILEPYGDLVDGLAHCMSDANEDAFRIDGAMPVGQVMRLIETTFGWAAKLDWSARENCARAWYVSEEKLEPRLGERFEEPIADYEQPLAPARDAAAALAVLRDWPADTPVAEVLLQHPEHRHTIRRAQMSTIAPYGEIRDNTIGADVLPIDMLRAKLSFFGATHFDPRSDRWVRICMYAGAPYPEDLSPDTADLWVYPDLPA